MINFIKKIFCKHYYLPEAKLGQYIVTARCKKCDKLKYFKYDFK